MADKEFSNSINPSGVEISILEKALATYSPAYPAIFINFLTYTIPACPLV